MNQCLLENQSFTYNEMLLVCGKAHFCKENHYFNTQVFSESITLQMLMWSLPMIFRWIFALLTVYYQYHMAIFSSSHIEILVMNKIYSKNLYLFSLLTMVILELQCEGDRWQKYTS